MPLAQVIGTILIVPESPRWLIAQGREAEALRILVKYHANGRSDDPLVQHEFCEIFEAIKLDQRAQSKSGYLDFFRTPGNRWRLGIIVAVGLMVQWAGNGIISYYLSPILGTLGVTSPVQQDALNGGLQIWNSIFALVGALLAERLGRRQLWLLSAIGMLISEIGVTIGSAVFSRSNIKGAGYAAVVFFFTFFGSYCLAFTPLNFLYIVEILPYRLRARGLALNQMIVFGSGFFNQYVSPIALASIRWHFYLIYIILLLIFIAVIYLTFPETSGLVSF